ncbi:MAG: pentapeptide repeat-containing protein, partial [Isosphaeraceae bacterium]
LFVVVGEPGWGRRTAMLHVAAVLPPWVRERVRLLGCRRPEDLRLVQFAPAGPDALIVIFASGPGARFDAATLAAITRELGIPADQVETYRLAPWDQDDAIEYLLAIHRDACASVMARLGRSGDFSFLSGIPELGAIVLDRMARDGSIADAHEALRLELADRLGADDGLRRRVETLCLAAVRRHADSLSEARGKPLPDPLARLVRHRPTVLLVAADRIAAIVEDGAHADPALAGRHTRELIREVARRIAGKPTAIEVLTGWMKPRHRGLHPMAASLLCAASPDWRPDPGGRPNLQGAYLSGARWSGVDLAGADLRSADLSRADLRWASLEKADARNAGLSGADLTRANLKHAGASDADLTRANLSLVDASSAVLSRANLQGACLTRARLWRAWLLGARIDGADFSGASLDDALLRELPLRLARFDGARFGGADLRGSDLEGMELPGVDFHDAKLNRADLTGARMPGANFQGADLRFARLAEVSWRGANLRDADLRGASFHLGSTRSGKLDSPTACEGSRTGFYTDDDVDLDRHVKPPEEIRKADLREVDLRGADIRDVDFYLVDLRDARYTSRQEPHLRRCRAILDEPA